MPRLNMKKKAVRRRVYRRRGLKRVGVRSLARQVNAMIERKHLDTNLTAYFTAAGGVSTTGPGPLDLSQVGQGDTETQRSGIRITPQSLKVDFQINGADTFNKLRIIIFKWFDTTPPNITDIIPGTGYTNYIQAPYNWVEGDRTKYKILADYKRLTVSSDKPVVFVKRSFKFSNMSSIRFTGSSASSGSYGRLYMMAVSDSAVLTHPQITGYTRLVFKDL